MRVLPFVLVLASGCGGRVAADPSPGSGPPASSNSPSPAPSGAPTPCPSDPASLASDPHHCGACGRDCLGGACVASTCQSVAIGSLDSVKAVDDLIVDASSLYFHELGSGLLKMAKDAAGPRVTLASLSTPARGPTRLLQTADAVFWAEGPLLHRVAKDGSERFEVTVPDGAGAALGGGYVYAANGTFVGRTPATAPGLPDLTKIADLGLPSAPPFSIAADDTSVFVASVAKTSIVTRIDVASSTTAEIATFSSNGVWQVEVRGDDVFLGVDSTIVRVSRTGGAPTLVRAASGLVERFVVDGSDIYYPELGNDANAAAPHLVRVSIAEPSSPPTRVTPDLVAVGAFAVDASAIYFVGVAPTDTKASVFKLAK